MAIIAVLAGAVIAVAGWFVSQYQARRAVRRNMRIDYLLAAYRRLERASNRPMTATEEREVEMAVADIQLLGSATQVGLAEEFVQSFAAIGEADTEPLLQDLRASLRKELLLESVEPHHSWLRIDRQGGTISDHSKVWHEADSATRAALTAELGTHTAHVDYGGEFPEQMRELATSASPSAAIEMSVGQIEHDLRVVTSGATNEDLSTLNVSQLAHRALQLGVIDAQLADAVNGLGVMRLLSVMDQDKLTVDQAMEFVTLSAAVLYAISRAGVA